MSEALSSPCAKTVLTGAALGGGLGASFGRIIEFYYLFNLNYIFVLILGIHKLGSLILIIISICKTANNVCI